MYNGRNERKTKIEKPFSLPNNQWDTYPGSKTLLSSR